MTGPLSLQNTKMVLSARFRLSRVFIISPTVQSSCRITSPRVPIPLFPAKRAWGTRGTCTSCVPMYIKKGSSLCLIIKSFALPVITSAMSSSTQRADLPPVIQPMRGIPFTIVLLCPWLGFSFTSSGFSNPVGQSPTLWL